MSDSVTLPEADAAVQARQQEQMIKTLDLSLYPAICEGIKDGRIVVAKLAVFKRWGMNLSFARSSALPCDVCINVPGARNPAMHGDTVAVELAPVAIWGAAGGSAGGGSAEPDARTQELMPGTLPDGRRIVRVLEKETEAAATVNAPPHMRIPRELGAPLQHNWPTDKQPVGRVVAVLHRQMNRYYAARLADGVRKNPGEPIRSGYLYRFTPYNPLMPNLVVAGRDIPAPYHDNLEEYLFLLRLVKTEDGEVAVGSGDMRLATVHCALGTARSVAANTAAIAATYGIKSETFPAAVEALVPDSISIPATEAEVRAMGRRDLRSEEFVCTIDPATARDLDDALSIRRTPGGGYHVGVHIADVSFFVDPNTALDEEAKSRSTSTYFIDHVVPMLPRKLSENHCSLNPNEDKLAFSCLFELDREGHVVSEWFGRSVIRSSCRLTYEEAQDIIDGKQIVVNLGDEAVGSAEVEAMTKQVYESVRLLFKVASKRRRDSLERGRLTISGSQLGFVFDDMNSQLAPRGFYVKYQIQANWVVEEMMLLANNRTAEKIVQFIPDGAMLRQHPSPCQKKMLALQRALQSRSIESKGSSAKKMQETLDGCKDHKLYFGVCEMMKSSLQAATYFANGVEETFERSHFALGLPWYTHFTSPIRRYCDIMAHRQLLVALELEEWMTKNDMELPSKPDPDVALKPGASVADATTLVDPAELKWKDYYYPCSEVSVIAAAANMAKEMARQAGERSAQLFFCMYLQALEKKSNIDPSIKKEQYTVALIIKLTHGVITLFAPEIASQVAIGVTDSKQRFTLVPDEEEEEQRQEVRDGDARVAPHGSAGGRGRGRGGAPAVDGHGCEIDAKIKAARRAKGGKAGMTKKSGAGDAGATPPVTVCWIDDKGEVEREDLELLHEVVVQLVLSKKAGMTTLDMIILPPWERNEYHKSGVTIPTSLE